MFLEYVGSLHFLPFLAVGDSREGIVPMLIEFQVATGDGSCIIFSDQDGSFVISCSLEAMFQETTRMYMPYVASGRGGVLLCW